MVLLAVPLLFGTIARADEETAAFFVDRAEKCLDGGNVDEAFGFVARALAEEDGYPPALLVRARIEQRRGNRDRAIKDLEACLAERRRLDPSTACLAAFSAAEKMLAELDQARLGFVALVDDYVKELHDLAKRAEKGDPELARACARAILAVRPDDARAKEGAKPPPPPGTPLFNGEDLDGWTGKDPMWQVQGGIVYGQLSGATLNRYLKEVEGKFAIRCEVKVLGDEGKHPMLGFIFGGKGTYDHFGLWLWPDGWTLDRQEEEGKRIELQRRGFKKYRGKFDPGEWHTYRIVRDDKRVTCYVDDQELWSFAGTDRTLDGFLGLWLQDQKVALRGMVLEDVGK